MFDLFSSAFASTPAQDARPAAGQHKSASAEIGRDRFEEILTKKGLPKDAIDTLFKEMDKNRDGRISPSDMKRVMKMYTERQTSDVPPPDAPAVDPAQQTDNNVAREEKSSTKPRTAMDPATIKDYIDNLRTSASTYKSDGSASFFATGIFFNALA